MKKFFVLSLLVAVNCFAVQMRVTKALNEIDLYVLENKYLVSTSSNIPGVEKGFLFNVNLDALLTGEPWQQEVPMYLGGWDYAIVNQKYTFRTVGTIDALSMDLTMFEGFAEENADSLKISKYSNVYMDNNWDRETKELFLERYDPAVSVVKLSEILNNLPEKFKHSIYPVYSIKDENQIDAFLHISKMRKVFLSDEVQGLAIVQN